MPSARCVSVRVASFLLIGLLGAVGREASARDVSAMPPGAFLRKPVPNTEALNQVLRADKLVLSRYSRLLHLSPDTVRATFAQLHLTRLQKDMLLEVHYVHAGETIGAKVRRVRKGTAVFALPNGTPMLVKVCGNPLRAIGNANKKVNVRRAELRGTTKIAQFATLDDVPDFDPTEPLNTPLHTVPIKTLMMRDAVPTVDVLPDPDILGPDEAPANTTEIGEILLPISVVQAQASLGNWASGIARTLTGILGPPNIINGVSENNSPIQTPPRTPPGKIVHTDPPPIPLTPEPGNLMFGVALVAAALASVTLRRRSPG